MRAVPLNARLRLTSPRPWATIRSTLSSADALFRSLALAGVLTWLTYTIAASFIVGPMGTPGEHGSPPPGAHDPCRGIVILVAPVFACVGLIFAAVAPTVARGYLVPFLANEPTLSPEHVSHERRFDASYPELGRGPGIWTRSLTVPNRNSNQFGVSR